MQRAGNELVKNVTPQGLNQSKSSQLQTETHRVPVDDHLPIKSRIEQKIRPEVAAEDAQQRAIRSSQETSQAAASQMDKTYVSKFLKEIDEIERSTLKWSYKLCNFTLPRLQCVGQHGLPRLEPTKEPGEVAVAHERVAGNFELLKVALGPASGFPQTQEPSSRLALL